MYIINKVVSLPKMKLWRALSIPLSKLDRVQHDEILMKPFDYIGSVPSKHHKKICLSFNHWTKAPREKVEAIGDILQMFHTASLLVDDIQDDSAYRYGVPAAHRAYGVGLTVNASSSAMLLAAKKASELGHPSAVNIFLDGYIDTFRGQGIDLYWTNNFLCPSIEEHINMLKQKAASFFVMAVQLLQLFSNSKEDYTKLAVTIGIYYPIMDDYFNLFDSEALKGLTSNNMKQGSPTDTFCSDITECKFSLPIIHALQYPDVSKQIFDILKQRTTDPGVKKYCISLLKRHGSDEYTREVLWDLEADIRAEINRLGGNPAIATLMDDLSVFKKVHDKESKN